MVVQRWLEDETWREMREMREKEGKEKREENTNPYSVLADIEESYRSDEIIGTPPDTA